MKTTKTMKPKFKKGDRVTVHDWPGFKNETYGEVTGFYMSFCEVYIPSKPGLVNIPPENLKVISLRDLLDRSEVVRLKHIPKMERDLFKVGIVLSNPVGIFRAVLCGDNEEWFIFPLDNDQMESTPRLQLTLDERKHFRTLYNKAVKHWREIEDHFRHVTAPNMEVIAGLELASRMCRLTSSQI
jgi:hypothetical protein